MHQSDRVKLLGNYRTPRFKYGQRVFCAVRGESPSRDCPRCSPDGPRNIPEQEGKQEASPDIAFAGARRQDRRCEARQAKADQRH
jgi:hypothetical protein